DAHEVAGIGFLVDQALYAADRPVEKLRGAVIGIDAHEEEALILAVPDACAAGVCGLSVQVNASGQVAYAQRVIFRALVIMAPEQPAVVMAVIGAADAEIGLARRFGIAVEQDLLFTVRRCRAV